MPYNAVRDDKNQGPDSARVLRVRHWEVTSKACMAPAFATRPAGCTRDSRALRTGIPRDTYSRPNKS